MSALAQYIKSKELRLLEVLFAATLLISTDQPEIANTVKALVTGDRRYINQLNARSGTSNNPPQGASSSGLFGR